MGFESLEYNIIVVKWGNKFTSEHVNRIYRMAKRNISLPFNFYCYTDDSNGIISDVNIIQLDKNLNLEKWWWKLTLFKKNNQTPGINLYLDLDVVIHKNIDSIFNQVIKDKIVILENKFFTDIFEKQNELKNSETDMKTFPFCNSSIMIWFNNQHQDLYEKFVSNIQLYTKIYLGIDRFFSYEIPSTKFVFLEQKFFYYRIKFYNESDDGFTKTYLKIKNSHIPLYYNPNRSICVFNGCHDDIFYKGMEEFLL